MWLQDDLHPQAAPFPLLVMSDIPGEVSGPFMAVALLLPSPLVLGQQCGAPLPSDPTGYRRSSVKPQMALLAIDTLTRGYADDRVSSGPIYCLPSWYGEICLSVLSRVQGLASDL